MEDEIHAFCKELLPETRQIGTRQRRFWDESTQIIMYQDLLFGSNPPNKMCVSWVVSSSSFYGSSCINDTSTSVSSTLGSDWWFEAIPSTYISSWFGADHFYGSKQKAFEITHQGW